MLNRLVQPNGSSAIETNRSSIARIYGVTEDKVTELEDGVSISSDNILYHAETESLWEPGTATGTFISISFNDDGSANLVTSNGSYNVVEKSSIGSISNYNKKAIRNTFSKILSDLGLNLVDGSFEEGAKITDSFDAVLHYSSGTCYVNTTNSPLDIPRGTDPTTNNSWMNYRDSTNDVFVNALWFIPISLQPAILSKVSTNDVTPYFRIAATYAFTRGKRLYVPAGTYCMKTGSFPPNYGVKGDGIGLTVFKTYANAGGCIASLGFFDSTDSWKTTVSCTLEGFSIEGEENNFYAYDAGKPVQYDTSRTTSDSPIVLGYYKRLVIKDIEVNWSRGFSILATRNKELLIENVSIRFSMRDAIRVLGNQHVQVSNCVIRHCGDDAITAGTNYGGEDLKPWGDVKERTAVITNNIAIDTKGIRSLGATNTNISNNILQRVKESGIIAGGQDGTEGLNDNGFIIIEGNIINDMISGELVFSAGGSNAANNSEWNTGITLMSRIASTGTENVPPGRFDYSNKKFVLPEKYFLSSISSGSPSCGARNVSVKNNQIQRTLPYIGNYSDWGFDNTVFTPTGWVDPDMSSSMSTGYGINIRSNGTSVLFAFYGLNISDNIIYGVDIGINLSGAKYLGFVSVKDNTFMRVNTSGLKLGSGRFANSGTMGQPYGLINIKDNYFDLDPYLENPLRNADGSWNSISYPCAIERTHSTGLTIKDNIFRNLCTPFTSREDFNNNSATMSTTGTGVNRNNIFVCSPQTSWTDTTTGTLLNKGVRFIGNAINNDFLFEDSDPTSSTYLSTLSSTASASAASIPSSGYYLPGFFVSNTAVSLLSEIIKTSDTTNITYNYVIKGWLRLTAGSAHVSGVDWVAVKETISFT